MQLDAPTRVRVAPSTLPLPRDLAPVELSASRGLPAGWGLMDTRTGRVIFGNDRRRGRHADAAAAAEWAATSYPLIRRVAAKGEGVTINPPGARCPTCGTPLTQDVADETKGTVVTVCEHCRTAEKTRVSRRYV